MAVTWGDVVALDPSLSTVPLATQTAILELVYSTLPSACPWGGKYDTAIKLLAAHMGVLWLRSQGGVTGLVLEEKVGDVSRKYGAGMSASGHDLDQTMWGQAYARLLKGTLGARGPLVT